MKSVALLALALSGCTTVPKVIESASTTYSVTKPDGTKVSLTFPKELAAKNLTVQLGEAKIEASEIQSSSTSVIDSAGTATAKANEATAKTIQSLTLAIADLLKAVAVGSIAPVPAGAQP